MSREGTGPTEAETGMAVTVGPSIKMSKAKRNTVDPEEIISRYGADTARWFMLSDTPPDRDIEWTEAGIEGAWRFTQRIWRAIEDALETMSPPGMAMPADLSDQANTLRRSAHKAIVDVTSDIEAFRFNRAVARIYALTNDLAAFKATGEDADWVRRETVEILVRLFAPAMPHLAEECWALLGHTELVANTAWPEAEPALLVEDEVTIAVQVNGKRRATAEQIAHQVDAVTKALAGMTTRKIILVPNRILNFVVTNG